MQVSTAKSISFDKLNLLDILVIDNEFATATVSLFGGHVLSYKPKSDSRERLWLSEKAVLDGSKAIRGGVPVCWPWFSDSHGQAKLSLPSHGFVRAQPWQLTESEDSQVGTKLVLSPNTTTGLGFTGEAELKLVVIIGKSLRMSVQTSNKGTSLFSITCALHTYFAIEHITRVELSGLTGEYKDKTQSWQVCPTPTPYKFERETDRIHLCQAKQVNIIESKHSTAIKSQGHDSLVVWNPWMDLSCSMSDMPDDGFEKMLCVETAVTGGIDILPGQTHSLTQEIS